MTETAAPEAVVISRTIAAPAERIFNAWIDPSQIKSWFTPHESVTILSAEVDAREGGSYKITFIGGKKIPFSVSGSYRKVSRFTMLVFTWSWDDPELGIGETLVTVKLTEMGAETELVLTHELLPTAERRESHAHGWTAILGNLAKLAEAGG